MTVFYDQSKTSLRQKIFLILFGCIPTLILLKAGLRLGGAAFLFLQERNNTVGGGEYRIMCIGESTTALGGRDSYPSQLEEMLNQKSSERKFKVINKGVPSHLSGDLLDYLEHNRLL